MPVEFKVPALGEGVDTAEVSQIYVSEGDTIEADQGVMELETEKAVADLPCPHAGKIAEIHVSTGDTIQVGQTVLTLEDQQPASKDAREDVVQVHDRSRPGAAAANRMSQPPLPDFTKHGQVQRQPLNKVARTAMKNLGASWAVIPHVTQHDVADITDLESARRRYLADSDASNPKITLTAIAVKAVTVVLKQFPHFNASLDTEKEELILKEYYHIGIAVDTERGLLVPVLHNADRQSVFELAAKLAEVAEKARTEKIGLNDMEGATFTISNQGGIGGTSFTPIVNFPQVAILGMSRARTEVQIRDGRPEERLMLPLSLSYDHRAINGADAARFLVRLSAELSDCFRLLIRA